MKKSDLKILIKKVQNECALEEPTHITYYWNEDHKLVFKLFFDSLIIPEELIVDEDNISKCFSEQNVYEFEDDFVIKELNREKGYIEVIPDDQKFKVINSYKDYNEDEKDVKNESIVHLAGERISETFAKTKGFILRESEPQGPDAPVTAKSQAYLVVAFTMYLLNNGNKKQFIEFLNSLGALGKGVSMPLKLIINVPQSAEQYVGIETYGNLPILLEKFKSWEDSVYILNSDHATEVMRTADPTKSLFISFGPDMISSLQQLGVNNFKNPEDLKNKVEALKKENNCDALYEQFLNISKKAYDEILSKSDGVVKAFLKKYNVNEGAPAEEVANNFKNNSQWPEALKEYDSIKDNDPPTTVWRTMHFIEMYFTMGKDASDLKEAAGTFAEIKKIHQKALKEFKDTFNRGAKVGFKTITSDMVRSLNDLRKSFTAAKTADASKEDSGIWQDTEMAKGKSSAGVDFTDEKSKEKIKGDLINPVYFLDVFVFFSENKSNKEAIMERLTLDASNINLSSKENKEPEKNKEGDQKQSSKEDSGKDTSKSKTSNKKTNQKRTKNNAHRI